MLCSPLEFLFQSVLFAVNSASMTWNCVRVRFRWKTTRKLMLIKRVCTKIGKDEVRLIPPLWSAKEFPECFASWWLRDKEQDQFRKHCENCETALNPGIPCVFHVFQTCPGLEKQRILKVIMGLSSQIGLKFSRSMCSSSNSVLKSKGLLYPR